MCLCALLIACIVLLGAKKSWGQDLGALARQEQARKAAEPAHAVHIYTNDDLERPNILVPKDDVDLGAARRKLPPSLMQLPPAAEPEAEPTAQTHAQAQEVSLGEIARKNREEKIARQAQPLQPVHLAELPHVYTNDDMARPKILTPEDDARYLAGLKKPVPVQAELIAPEVVRAETEKDLPAPQPLHAEPAASEMPLGDIARAAYQELHPPEPMLSARGPGRPRYPWRGKLVAYRIRRPSHASPGLYSEADLPRRRRAYPLSIVQAARREQILTVRAGDSLWKLAREHLGRGLRWRELLQANPWIKNPNSLRVGTQIRI
jgi:nucleoid-associated protein YgaU